MNKQELIERIDSKMFAYPLMEPETEDDTTVEFKKGFNCACENIKRLADQKLDEPKKVVVPKFVAIELDKLKDKYLTLMDLYTGDVNWLNNGTFYLEGKELELAKWVNENETIFEYAWIHGYEVKKEQLYYVLLPEIGEHESKYFLDQDGELSVDNQLCEYYKLTEQEIKSIDERYWPFAVKVDGE
ncbi:hypothetical protein B6A11_01415 [Enterococcus faecalis]|uniref:DUF1642 domain-containing protein n=1 Tax=Enterococcus faecalis TaxID=1351 RepID=UPI0009FA5972|nr:DUF1642 domain-containing protein [Enterococcus faecalis]ORE55029.1 hypothetical protein B6A11_01415 [Enterococcus faecalis]